MISTRWEHFRISLPHQCSWIIPTHARATIIAITPAGFQIKVGTTKDKDAMDRITLNELEPINDPVPGKKRPTQRGDKPDQLPGLNPGRFTARSAFSTVTPQLPGLVAAEPPQQPCAQQIDLKATTSREFKTSAKQTIFHKASSVKRLTKTLLNLFPNFFQLGSQRPGGLFFGHSVGIDRFPRLVPWPKDKRTDLDIAHRTYITRFQGTGRDRG
jgi:hypothetical protein